MLVYGAWPVSDLWLHNDFYSSDRVCSSTQCYMGTGGESDYYLHTLGVLWAFAQWKVSNSGNGAVVSHEGQGWYKNQVECILLAAEKSCILLHGCSREHDKEENDWKKILLQAFHFLLNFLSTVTWEVLNSSGSFTLCPCKVHRQLYSREKETFWIAVSTVTNLNNQMDYQWYWYTNRSMTEWVQQKFYWDNSHNMH